MSITERYIKIQRENERLKKLLAFVCAQFEAGETTNLEDERMHELWAWWGEYKKLSKQREVNK
jgi:hypothetical protein